MVTNDPAGLTPPSELEPPLSGLSSVGTATAPAVLTDAPETGTGPQTVKAGFWIRVAAWAIDLACLCLTTSVLIFVVITTIFLGGQAGGEINDQVVALAGYSTAAIVMLGGIVYFTVFVGSCGQTPGKMLLRLKIVRVDGQEITYGVALRRSLCWIVSLLFFSIGFLMIALTRHKRGLHDILAGTFVIRLPRSP